MSNLSHKFDVLKDNLEYEIKLVKNFGFYIGFIHFLMKIVFQGPKSILGKKLYRYMYSYCEKRLGREYRDLIEAYGKLNDIRMAPAKDDCPIWVFWWQGEENAPKPIKICIDSIRKNNPDHELIVITKENFREYSDIPTHVIDKVQSGVITLTHFSDILRAELLYRNGGVWCDATLWMTGTIPAEAFSLPFFTIRHGKYADYHVCRGKWSSFCMSTGAGNLFFMFVRDFLYKYWENETLLICYLIIDVAFCLAYDNFSWAKEMIELVPINNTGVFGLQEHMNEQFDTKGFEIMKEESFAHKVSYKIPFKEKVDGKMTYWAFFNNQME